MLIDVKETSFYLYIIDMAAFDQMRLLHLKKKIPTLCSVYIEADKICQTKKKKDMLDSENQK